MFMRICMNILMRVHAHVYEHTHACSCACVGVGICPRAFERQTIFESMIPYVTLGAAVCVRTPRRSVIYYILLAAIGAVSGVFAYYPTLVVRPSRTFTIHCML